MGRRLDQAWRALEWWGMQWFERDDTHLVISRVHTPADAPPPAVLKLSFDAIDSPEQAHRFLVLTGDTVAQMTLEPVSVASGLFAARLSFSAYRLCKCRWLNTAVRTDHLIRRPAYQWWEA